MLRFQGCGHVLYLWRLNVLGEYYYYYFLLLKNADVQSNTQIQKANAQLVLCLIQRHSHQMESSQLVDQHSLVLNCHVKLHNLFYAFNV